MTKKSLGADSTFVKSKINILLANFSAAIFAIVAAKDFAERGLINFINFSLKMFNLNTKYINNYFLINKITEFFLKNFLF